MPVATVDLLLPAPTPRDWLATHLAAHQARHDDPYGPAERTWVGTGELIADGAALLHAGHARLVADGASPAAAAKWLTGWFAGRLADTVGYALATAEAGLIVRPGRARFRLHPGGWPDRVDPGPVTVAVVPGHPWAGQDGVVVVADETRLAGAAVQALARAVEPLVEACRGLARVGRNALWAEVADRFGLPVLHEPDLPVDGAVVERLQLAVRGPDRPWRAVPQLRVALTAAGWGYLGRKGGCCLAYQSTAPEPDPETLPASERAYRERFPDRPGEPRYCSTCALRDLDGCEQRQIFRLAQARAHPGDG